MSRRGLNWEAAYRHASQRLCRNTKNIDCIGPSVISTAGRNLRSLTSVRDDNPPRIATQSPS